MGALAMLSFAGAHRVIASLARIIVYSMTPDSVPTPGSTAPTPMMTPVASGANTPLPHHNGTNGFNGALADYLSAPLLKAHAKTKTYRGGSKALDSLSKLIASTEGFFHPTNSGNWTTDVGFLRDFLFLLNSICFPVERLCEVHRLRLQ